MPRNFSPIRWDVINEAKLTLKVAALTDAPMKIKMFHTFRNRDTINKGLSFKEQCIIFHGDRCYRNSKGDVVIPVSVEHQMKNEISDFRKDMKSTTIILYCIADDFTGALLYFNITTKDLLDIIDKRADQIVKGLHKNKKKRREVLKLTKAQRKREEKRQANEHRRKIVEQLKKKMERERKEELEKLLKQREQEEEEKARQEEEQEEKGGQDQNDNNDEN